MNFKNAIIATAIITCFFTAPGYSSDDLKEAKKVAEKFIQHVDKNQAEELKAVMHPDMLQYTNLGGKLIPFKGTDFIQMIADKKLGGKARKISHKSADVIRGGLAYVIVNAVSHEYDFMYHLSMAKNDGKWVIVGIVADIVKL
ncbi:MAG: nuclear transport factor 2 family protein [Bacteroidota bacterium]